MKANYQITLSCDNCDSTMIYEPEFMQRYEEILCQICGCNEMRKLTNSEEILFEKGNDSMNQMRALKADAESLKATMLDMRKKEAKRVQKESGWTTEEIRKQEAESVVKEAGTILDDPESERYDKREAARNAPGMKTETTKGTSIHQFNPKE